MKASTVVLLILGLGIIAGTIFYLERPKASPVLAKPVAAAASNRTLAAAPSVAAAAPQPTRPRPVPEDPGDAKPAPVVAPALADAKADDSAGATAFSRAIDILVSKQSSFQQRQAAWKQLREAGELDQAIAALKQGAADNPASSEYPTALGEAYVYKLQTVRDYHKTAILALQADQSFNTALGLDPANWEAQFFKAASLAHWPPEMNKGPEVIQQLSSLIDQQEAQPPQPQFAQTYVLLGDQYQKAGQPDYALQTWRLGAQKFPGDPTLQNRINHPPGQ
jgi:tetratricopeptide (TPR) repeat protein